MALPLDGGVWAKDGAIEGTGFYYSPKEAVDCYLVTCRHVLIEDMMTVQVHECDADGRFVSCVSTGYIPLEQVICPSNGIDLAAIPLKSIVRVACGQSNYRSCVTPVENLVEDEVIRRYGGFQQTVMIGYPYSLSDDYNNLPIWRTGNTASHPLVDFRGKPQGINNIGCFPADSGAPVFLVHDATVPDIRGNVIIGSPKKFLLLGIHNSGLHSDGAKGLHQHGESPRQEPDEVETEASLLLPLGVYLKVDILRSINNWGSYHNTKDAYESL